MVRGGVALQIDERDAWVVVNSRSSAIESRDRHAGVASEAVPQLVRAGQHARSNQARGDVCGRILWRDGIDDSDK